MKKLKIVKEPAKILHQISKEVVKVDEKLLNLIQDMAHTMYESNGVGLAAPQIDKSIRVFVVAHKEGVVPFINPEIYWYSKATSVSEEGCLSIPGVYVKVRRSESIKIKFLNQLGEKQDIEIKGFFARVVQHEYDHLNGVLITEKNEDERA